MEKLIELLNEFKPAIKCANFKEHYEFIDDDIYLIRRGLHEEEQFPMYVCYKKGEFIKWLVDNDKINLEVYKDKSELYTLKVVHGTDYYIDLKTNKVNSDFLLMLLSIQDNPIEFLISILKDKKIRTVYVDEDGNVSGDTKRYSDC